MKNKLILMMCMCALFVSCSNESETAPVDPNPINISQSEREESTLVTIDAGNYTSWLTSVSIKISDENGKEVGGGANVGSYLVPHGGSVCVTWTWERKGVSGGALCSGSETVFVGSAYEIKCEIYREELSIVNLN